MINSYQHIYFINSYNVYIHCTSSHDENSNTFSHEEINVVLIPSSCAVTRHGSCAVTRHGSCAVTRHTNACTHALYLSDT